MAARSSSCRRFSSNDSTRWYYCWLATVATNALSRLCKTKSALYRIRIPEPSTLAQPTPPVESPIPWSEMIESTVLAEAALTWM